MPLMKALAFNLRQTQNARCEVSRRQPARQIVHDRATATVTDVHHETSHVQANPPELGIASTTVTLAMRVPQRPVHPFAPRHPVTTAPQHPETTVDHHATTGVFAPQRPVTVATAAQLLRATPGLLPVMQRPGVTSQTALQRRPRPASFAIAEIALRRTVVGRQQPRAAIVLGSPLKNPHPHGPQSPVGTATRPRVSRSRSSRETSALRRRRSLIAKSSLSLHSEWGLR